MIRRSAFLLLAVTACATPKEAADTTTTLAAIDTLKPAVVDSAADTTARDSSGVPVTKSTMPPAGSQTSTRTAPRDTTNIGRDRAIQINTKDPKVYLPTVDTAKKRPPQ